jgi:hypothetical protein
MFASKKNEQPIAVKVILPINSPIAVNKTNKLIIN